MNNLIGFLERKMFTWLMRVIIVTWAEYRFSVIYFTLTVNWQKVLMSFGQNGTHHLRTEFLSPLPKVSSITH